MIYAVIMAGGSGTRFWPKSTKQMPKQFLKLFGDGTMIQNTAKRIEEIIPQDKIMVVTNNDYVPIINEQLSKIPAENIVGEPVPKNTAPCVAIAAELLLKKDPDAVMIVLPADHHIEDEDTFLKILNKAVEKANEGENLVTIGIQPTRPETGYGYIHAEKNEDKSVLKVKGFKEKPNLPTAKQFIESGDYYWNSGMFVWRADTILEEFKKHLPDMYQLVKQTSPELYTDTHNAAINDFYLNCNSISIDYGIMEQSANVFVVPGQFGWNDVGSWTSVYELSNKEQNGNSIQTINATFADAENNLVVSNSDKMISVVGLDNIAVVETENAILVCDLNKAQNVKEIVDILKSNPDYKKYL